MKKKKKKFFENRKYLSFSHIFVLLVITVSLLYGVIFKLGFDCFYICPLHYVSRSAYAISFNRWISRHNSLIMMLRTLIALLPPIWICCVLFSVSFELIYWAYAVWLFGFTLFWPRNWFYNSFILDYFKILFELLVLFVTTL